MRLVPSLLVAACVCAAALPVAANANVPPPPPLPTVPVPATPQAPPCAGADLTLGTTSTAGVRQAVVCLLNAQRAAAKLQPLRPNRALGRAAAGYATAMVRGHFFSHVSPSGSTLLTRVVRTTYLRHAGTWALGEDLAWGTGAYATPRAIVEAWMASPPHRRNILEPTFRDVGIGVSGGVPSGAADGATYVADFGIRTA
jgi:uncharacterized protein YkwD